MEATRGSRVSSFKHTWSIALLLSHLWGWGSGEVGNSHKTDLVPEAQLQTSLESE